MALSDRIYVMKDGAVVAEMPAAEATSHRLHELMVGRSRNAEYYREQLQQPYRPEVALAASGLTLAGAYRDVDFELHAGEVLGIAGVIGSGREELARTLGGLAPATAGKLTVFGTPRRSGQPRRGGRPRDRLRPARAPGRGDHRLPAGLSPTSRWAIWCGHAPWPARPRSGTADRESWVKRLTIRTPSIRRWR